MGLGVVLKLTVPIPRPLGCVWYAGQDGTIFSCPAFGAPIAWDGTGQGGTKFTKNLITLQFFQVRNNNMLLLSIQY